MGNQVVYAGEAGTKTASLDMNPDVVVISCLLDTKKLWIIFKMIMEPFNGKTVYKHYSILLLIFIPVLQNLVLLSTQTPFHLYMHLENHYQYCHKDALCMTFEESHVESSY